jgi:hypothetical protein
LDKVKGIFDEMSNDKPAEETECEAQLGKAVSMAIEFP